MKESWTYKYRPYLTDKSFIISVLLGLVLLLLSMAANSYAVIYATEKASNSVTDIVLDNVPLVNVDGVSVYGPLLLWGFVAYLCLTEPKRIPFVLKSIALFVIIRSFFVMLTHIGPFPGEIYTMSNLSWLQKMTYGGDLFFSGHTGLPFLMALVFGKDKRLFVLFTFAAVFFGVMVLLAHLHYSIDVLSAFFITYTIYHIAIYVFKEDSRLFDAGFSAN